jgi:predicted  nucleic acid-binding Zn-ribbon protein
MQKGLKDILEIQEHDVKMIRLLELRKARQKELNHLGDIKKDFEEQIAKKEKDILNLKKDIRMGEVDVQEADEKVKKLEGQQSAVRKVEEFNALSREIAAAERQKANKEQALSDLIDKVDAEETLLESMRETKKTTIENSIAFEQEILESIKQINAEGRELKAERDHLVKHADPETFSIYEKLLKNKRDRVAVPLENRTCSGCHIQLTPQHENMVRKGERLIYCEHCSRILYWPDSEDLEGTEAQGTKRRRRKVAT